MCSRPSARLVASVFKATVLVALVFVSTITIASAQQKKGAGSDVEIYLEVTGIPGEVTLKGFENQIAVSAFSWGASNTFRRGTSGGLVGKANLQDLSIIKAFDSTSPEFFLRAMTATFIPKAVLRVVRIVDGVRKPYLAIELENVVVTSLHLGQASGIGENIGPETLSLAFTKVKVGHTGLDGSVTEKSWNVVTSSPL